MNSMWEMVAGLSDQYRWSADLSPPPVPPATAALVCGMGGSGISGDIAAAANPEASITVNKAYSLPTWAGRLRPLVVAVSYSGDTEETRSAVDEALGLELSVAVVTVGGTLGKLAGDRDLPIIRVPSGLQPRAALGFLTGGVLRLLEASGVVEPQQDPLGEAAAVVEELWGGGSTGPAARLAQDLAAGLAARIPLIYGSTGPTQAVAQRWKTQINENAKRPAFWSVLPELNHNEIVGWSALEGLNRRALGILLLRDHGEHPRIARRFDLTVDAVSGKVPVVGEVWTQGTSLLARMAGLALVGDLLSVDLADQEGVDPIPVDVINHVKAKLNEER